MQKQKIFSCVLCFFTAFSFFGCGGEVGDDGKTYKGKTGEEIYTAIMTNFAAYSSNYTVGIQLTTAMKSQSLGMTTRQNVVAYLEYRRESMTKEYYTQTIRSEMDGSMPMTVIGEERQWRDGTNVYYYTSENALGEISEEKRRETLEGGEGLDGLALSDLEIPTVILKELTFEEKEKTVVMSATIDMDGVAAGMEGIFEWIGSMGDVSLGMSMEISEMLMQIYLTKDCNLKYIDFSYSMQAGLLGGLLGNSYGDAMIRIAVTDLGKTIISLPSDKNEYLQEETN